jgi:hypothetical protein
MHEDELCGGSTRSLGAPVVLQEVSRLHTSTRQPVRPFSDAFIQPEL